MPGCQMRRLCSTDVVLDKMSSDTPYKQSGVFRHDDKLPGDRTRPLLVRFEGDHLTTDSRLEHQSTHDMDKNNDSLAIFGVGLFAVGRR